MTGVAAKRGTRHFYEAGIGRPADKRDKPARFPASFQGVRAGFAAMAHDKRISVADAAGFIGTPDAPGIIEQARKRGVVRLRGVPAGKTKAVEISPSERGEIDCSASRIGVGTLLTTYRSVTIAWADVKRLAQADVERLAREAREAATSAAPAKEAPQGASNSDILGAEAGPLVKAVALELRRHFPESRPSGFTRDKLMHYVHEKSEGKIDIFSPATLDRAIELAWPRAKRSRAPKALKQPP
jgi:hypothetical protein